MGGGWLVMFFLGKVFADANRNARCCKSQGNYCMPF